MQTIIVPTDFSPSADNAMNYAAQLAQMVNASVFLVHLYQIPISMNDVPVMMVSADELKFNADKSMERTREQLQRNFPSLDIKAETRLGDVVDELKDICSGVQPLAIVVGKHGATGIERFLFGSTTLSIIRHMTFPVISVPDSVTTFQLNNVALAVDGSDIGTKEPGIKNFVQQTAAQLHVIHVQEKEKETPVQLTILNEVTPVHQTIRSDEVDRGINSYIQTNAIDLLMILPHKHSLMERIFFKTHTKELIEKIRIPIMCIPET
jgi:nucleotide-binding universal stress UspA family protein